MILTDFIERKSQKYIGGHNFVPRCHYRGQTGDKNEETYAKKRKYGSQNSLFSIYISHFLSENYRF